MTGIDKNGVSFGKNQKINFDNFNGIRKQDLKNVGGGALSESLFAKYDKNKDDVLDSGELQTLKDDINEFAKDRNLSKKKKKKFFKNLGLEKGHDLKRGDLFEFLQTIEADKDSISRAVTDGNGKTILEFKPDENNVIKRIVYSNEADGSHRPVAEQTEAEGYTRTLNFNEDGSSTEDVVTDKKLSRTEYNASGKPVYMLEKDLETNDVITSEFSEDGTSITARYRRRGAVTEFLDPNNGDRVAARVTDKGDGVSEVVQFTYNDDGSVTETTLDAEGNPVSFVTKKNGEEIASGSSGEDGKTVQTSGKDGVTTEFTTTGEGDAAQRVKVEKDKDGNIISRVSVDENGNPVAYKHKVNQGENWYNIVKAKYGITDHKQIMEIVHQLKDSAGVKRSSALMPSEIQLPPSVTLKDGTQISLRDIEAKVDVPSVPTPAAAEAESAPAAGRAEPAEPVDGTTSAETPEVSVPETDTNPPEDDMTPPLPGMNLSLSIKPLGIHETIPNWANAGKTVKNPDGTSFTYDENGFITNEYDADGNLTRNIERNSDGSVRWYTDFEYDASGNKIRWIVRNADGSVDFYTNIEYDADGNATRSIGRNSDGSVRWYEDYEYDADGNLTRNIYRNSDGSVRWYKDYEYDADGNVTREIYRNSDGSVQE